jgi:hypothetical protein
MKRRIVMMIMMMIITMMMMRRRRRKRRRRRIMTMIITMTMTFDNKDMTDICGDAVDDNSCNIMTTVIDLIFFLHFLGETATQTGAV